MRATKMSVVNLVGGGEGSYFLTSGLNKTQVNEMEKIKPALFTWFVFRRQCTKKRANRNFKSWGHHVVVDEWRTHAHVACLRGIVIPSTRPSDGAGRRSSHGLGNDRARSGTPRAVDRIYLLHVPHAHKRPRFLAQLRH